MTKSTKEAKQKRKRLLMEWVKLYQLWIKRGERKCGTNSKDLTAMRGQRHGTG